jgi:predicted nucleotidyltransferase
MATEFDPLDLKAQLAKLDDYEIEREIERKMWEGERLRVAQKILKERIRARNKEHQTLQLLWELAAIVGSLIISLGLALYAIRDRIF